MPHHQKRGDSACHVSENVQSVDLGGYSKTKIFTRTESYKKKITWGKLKVIYITGVNVY